MPQSHAGVGSTPRIQLLLKAVIPAVHWHGDLSFHAISAKLNVNERTASGIVQTAKVCDPAFQDILVQD